ncbi:MAG TPA: amino acid adenylation domain-containing protein, partial [Thermoanaerobaculia bacterium]|nr:amino acid adenylation domain-containing protein [Thermoanaerobaculia bacterium]
DLLVPVVDLGSVEPGRREAEARALTAAEARRPFDLRRAPLLRAVLVRLAGEEHALLLTLHHIASDGWSTGVLVREIVALYRAFSQGQPSPLPELPVQYADFALWQRGWLQGEALEAQLAYWREVLAGAPVLQLATDRPRTALQSHRGADVVFRLPAEVSEGVRSLSRQWWATPFMVLLAGFEALLQRYTGQDDLIVGSTIANRTRSELEGLIGFFVNTLALRGDLSGSPDFSAVLVRVRESSLGAYAHQDLPFEKLVAELQPERDLSRSPLFQVLFQLPDTPIDAKPVELPGLALRSMGAGGQTAKFDLVLSLFHAGTTFTGLLNYNMGLFEASTAERLARHLGSLLGAMVAEPSLPITALPLLSATEWHQLVREWNEAPAESLGAGLLHERFAEQAARAPETTAVVCEGERLSYGDLEARSNQLARHLVRLGVLPGDRVGLCLERSAEMAVAILGVLKAGAAYVPLDPAYPQERLAFLVADSRPPVVLTQESLAALLPQPGAGTRVIFLDRDAERIAREHVSKPRIPVSAEYPAYVIYTSGSTGQPKGVVVRHGNATRLFSATERWFGFGPEDVWTLFHSYAFDFSVWEIWGALLHGGRLVVVPYWVSRSPEAFYELLRSERVTVLNQTPSAFRQLIWAEETVLAGAEPDLALRYVIFGGEALEPAGLAPWFERHGDERPRLINMYGITETTVHVTWREVGWADVSRAVSAVGCPIPDLGVYLLDSSLQPVPVGVPGEIHVGGAGLAQGYLDRPELTAERFVPNPFGEAGSRLYRSGDLARRLPDGDLEYLGRIDHQVKIRGFRIELGEIESALVHHFAVREAVVLAVDDPDRRLVAWVVPAAGETPSLSDLRSFLAQSLPDYMLPSALVTLDALPLTANGKVDRRALPAPEAQRPDGAGSIAPRTPLEAYVAGLWQEVLKLERIGVQDDFFALGGNSISGAVLINRLQQELAEIVQVVMIFDHPTVETLSSYLAKEHPEAVMRLLGSDAAGQPLEGPKSGERVDESKLASFLELIQPPPAPVAPRKNRRAVLVLSPPRSGSTLLRVMLGGHPELFAPPELELLSFKTLRERSAAFSGRDSFWLEGVIRAVMEIRGCGAEEARELLAAFEREDMTTAELYGRMQDWLGRRTLVDKTPSYALDPATLRRAEETFEEPLYIHLIRHPGGMIGSFVEAKLDQIFFRREHNFSRRELAELIWLASHRNIGSFLQGIPAGRQHQVRFEDLLREPETVLRGICGFLGLDYDPAMAEPYQQGSARMTDGPHAESRMLGDVKFHTYSGVDVSVADRWREAIPESSLGKETRKLAAQLGYEETPSEAALQPIPRGGWREGEPLPLSFAQERLWFLDQLQPGSSAYNIPFALRLTGALDAVALGRVLSEIVRRHGSLRTAFAVRSGVPVQVVAPAVQLPLPWVDLGGVAPGGRETELQALAVAEALRPFDLRQAPLLRALLVRLGVQDHALLLTLHHIASDGWSTGVLVQEMVALYRAFSQGEPSPLPELPVQYADFALWQRGRLQGEALATQLAYWRSVLAGAPVLQLATDRPRRALQGRREAESGFALPGPVSEGVERLARQRGATPFMVLLAGFEALLQRYTGQDDLVVGSIIANRTRRELEGLIGFFVNTLALRGDLSGEPAFSDLLLRVRESAVGAYAHQDLPFEKLVAELQPERDLSRSPLFQVLFQLQNARMDAEPVKLPGLELRPMGAGGQTAKFDLVLNTFGAGSAFGGTLKYNTDLFEPATAARIVRHFTTLLAGAVAEPSRRLSELSLLSPEENHQLVREWNGAPAEDLGAGVLHERFAGQAARAPEATAVVCEGERLSYGDLEARSNQLARYLVRLGVQPGDRVGLCLERSVAMAVAIVGVLKAGAAYVPLDPAYPRERLAFLLADSRPPVVLTQEALADEVLPEPGAGTRVVFVDRDADRIERERTSALRIAVSAEHPAYVIYTSGSTGQPKGVVVRHGNAVRLFSATDRWFGFGPEDVWTLFHSYAFDFSVWEIWGALLYGGRLVIVPYWVSRSPEAFYELLRAERVTVLNQTPSAFRQLIWAEESVLAGAEPDLSLRYVIFGGEALEPASLAPWFERHGDERPRLVNMYGITETTVHVTWREVGWSDVGRAVSAVGCPIPDLGVYLLDTSLRLVPVGVPGEIHVGGAGLAEGYLGRPELTAERFVPHPFGEAGSRLYRSGDLARRLPEGDLEYLGRIDHQVKIRGFRIELGEIESALVRHPAVREAVVLAVEDPERAGGDRRLVAWVVPAGEEPSLSDLRSFLAQSLPDYMLPSALVLLESLPLTANGKVDRRALPAPEAQRLDDAGSIAPRTPLEAFVAGLWQEVLKLERIGVQDDFFELGGNSISGAVLINRLQQELAEIVQVVVIFDHPTVESLASYLAAEHPSGVARRLGAEAAGRPLGGEEPTEPVDEERLARFRSLVPPLSPLPAVARKNPPAIFVLSPPRSGTTLLRVMLGGHPELFAPPELELLSFATLAERKAAFPGRDSFWLEGVLRAIMEIRGCGPDEARALMTACEEEGLSTAELYGRLQEWLGDRKLVDKTPSYVLHPEALRRAEEVFDEPFYIHLIRHPYGMIHSFEEAKLDQLFFRSEHPFTRRELAELIWLASHGNVVEFLAGVPARRQHWVRYEDLVADPEGTLRGLCASLGIEYHPDMAEPYREKSSRMTDGLYAESRMLGDVKFHQHSAVDRQAAERWREHYRQDFLGEPTWELAGRLGYPPRRAGAETWTAIAALPLETDRAYPLSFAQERLWILDRMNPGSPVYNISAGMRLLGRLDVPAVAQSLTEIVRRHAVLRSVFTTSGGEPAQVPQPAAAVPLPVLDLAGLPDAEREAEARRLAQVLARQPFDLEHDLMLRVALVRLGEEEHGAFFGMHHVASDGWSMGVLIHEVSALYSAFSQRQPSPLPELPIQYVDYARWQREWLTGEVLSAQLAYWRQALAGITTLQLPTDRPRPWVQTFRGATRSFSVDGTTAGALKVLGQRGGGTSYMSLLAVFAALLQRYSGQEDVAVGSPTANRPRPELESLIGFFVNTLVLRTDLSGAPSFETLLGRVRAAALGAYAHQDVPFEKVVFELQPERNLSTSPLFQVMFALQNARAGGLTLPGLTLKPLSAEGTTAKFDLSLAVAESGGGFAGDIEYNTDLFDRSTIERLLGHFRKLLEGVVAEPGRSLAELPLMPAAERDQILVEWNATSREVPAGCIHERIAVQAARSPGAVAVACGGESLTYGELDRRANGLAHRLRRLGVGPEVRVGIALERSLEMVVGILAVLKAGGAYVPLDPSYPAERLAFMQEDAGISVLLSQETLPEEAESATPPASGACAQNVAYVLYTSGSTGRPKGVQVPHGALMNLLLAMAEMLEVTAGDTLLAIASLSFDIAGLELYLPLLAGGRVVVASREDAIDGRRLQTLIAESGATVLQATPATWRLLLESGWQGGEGLRGLSGGEALSPVLAASLLPKVASLWNGYGPTETTIYSTAQEITGAGPILIGRPIANTEAYVVDDRGHLVPAGVPGELLLGGVGLARGYLGRPDLTGERFVPDPFGAAGSRLYRTGDLARFRADGRLEYLGRIDHQVKVRGFRIELGEVEAALARHPEVAAAVVVAREESSADRRLVAYVVPRQAGADLSAGLRTWVRQSLPEYMVPSSWVSLAELPLTPSGKVDRKALPAPASGAGGAMALRTPTEEMLAGIWARVLGRETVGADDHFFNLGGHSLLATQVVSRVREAFGVELPLRRIFETPTLAGLARDLDALRAGDLAMPPLRPVPREGELPLSFAQERLWFLDQLQPGSSAYNMPFAVHLAGRLDVASLAASLREIVRRHESLRTSFAVRDGRPVQSISPAVDLPLPLVDLGSLAAVRRQVAVRALAAEEARQPFDLRQAPLLRALLVRLEGEEHALLLTLHHIASDAWSTGVLVREMVALYQAFSQGEPSPLPELPIQYADFAVWQRGWLHGEVLAAQLAYWRGVLAGAPVLQLATDWPRTALQGYRGANVAFRLPVEASEGVRTLTRQRGATPFMVLLAGFEALLLRYTGQDDLIVGSTIANRTRSELEGLIGFFINTLGLRAELAGDLAFSDLLVRARESALGAYAHQDLPFEKLVAELQPERDLSRSPLFQVLFQFQNAPTDAEPVKLPGLELRPMGAGGQTAKFDLVLNAHEAGGIIAGGLKYNTDLFEPATAARIVRHFATLLAGAVAAPSRRLSELPLLSAEESHQLAREWNEAPAEDLGSGVLHKRFAEQAARSPEATAVVCEGERLSYGDLDRRSNQLARH